VGHLKEFVVGQEGVSTGRAWETKVTTHFRHPWELLRSFMQLPWELV